MGRALSPTSVAKCFCEYVRGHIREQDSCYSENQGYGRNLKFSALKHTRHPVQDFSQRGGDGQMEGAVLVAGSIHGMLDQMAGGIDASFVQLKRKKKQNSFKMVSNLLGSRKFEQL